MKALITGANGQLGKALVKIFPDAAAFGSSQLDISDKQQVDEINLDTIDVIINAGAYTAVDDCEKPENCSKAWAVNSQGPANLVSRAALTNTPIVHISSDYVFDGSKSGAYSEADLFNPISVYGRSKAAGDYAVMNYDKHYIIRTSWVIGEGHKFINIMKSLAEKGVSPIVVDDQFGRLSFTDDIAKGIKYILENKAPFGGYNLTNSGEAVSWHEIAQLVFEKAGRDKNDVSPTSTEDYFKDKDFIAPRPHNSQLDLNKISQLGFTPTDWRARLDQYLS